MIRHVGRLFCLLSPFTRLAIPTFYILGQTFQFSGTGGGGLASLAFPSYIMLNQWKFDKTENTEDFRTRFPVTETVVY